MDEDGGIISLHGFIKKSDRARKEYWKLRGQGSLSSLPDSFLQKILPFNIRRIQNEEKTKKLICILALTIVMMSLLSTNAFATRTFGKDLFQVGYYPKGI